MMNDERDPRDDAAEPVTDRPSDDVTAPIGDATADAAPAIDAPGAAEQAADEFEAPPPTSGEADIPPVPEAEPDSAPAPAPAPAPAWPDADQPGVDGFEAPAEAAAELPPASEPWPTEPPAAGSGDADTWPTRAPERDDEPAWEPAAHPPSEAEAYATPPVADEPHGEDTAAMAAAAATTPAHSVPAATEMGESTQCPRCGTENRPGLAFCRNCGQRLAAAGVAATVQRPGTPEGTMACPRCGTHNRAGVAFCQNCGANLRAAATPGYVPPSAGVAEPDVAATAAVREGGAVLGPVVLIIGALGIIAGWLLPFPYGASSLFDRAFGSGGYGAAFWNGYSDVPAGIADQAYFGFAGPSPLLAALLVVLAIAGFMRARPGALQSLGLGVALIWAVGLAALFVVVEVVGNMGGPVTELLRSLTPGGIIFFLASLIVLIGTLTRFARS
jgi:hypothetical protein